MRSNAEELGLAAGDQVTLLASDQPFGTAQPVSLRPSRSSTDSLHPCALPPR